MIWLFAFSGVIFGQNGSSMTNNNVPGGGSSPMPS